MSVNWKHMVGAVVASGALAYTFGHMDGAAPAGTAKPSVAAVQDASQTGQQYLHTGVDTGKNLIGEGGGLLATGGAVASSAGNTANTVPGGPPKSAGG